MNLPTGARYCAFVQGEFGSRQSDAYRTELRQELRFDFTSRPRYEEAHSRSACVRIRQASPQHFRKQCAEKQFLARGIPEAGLISSGSDSGALLAGPEVPRGAVAFAGCPPRMAGVRIAVRTAGGSSCEVLHGGDWTCHDLHLDVQRQLGVPVSQQRLLHGGEVLEECMAAAAVGSIGQVHRLSAGRGGTLELLLYVRSAAVVAALEAVKKAPLALRHAAEELRGDREVVLEAVRQNGFALEYASEELRRDREVVKAAVKQRRVALQFASEELRRDREFIMHFVKQHGLALRYASEELKQDREVVMEAMKTHGLALRYASEELKRDREVVMQAVKQDGRALQFASEEQTRDMEVVMEAVKQNAYVLQFASEQLKRNREIVMEAVKQGGFSLRYTSEELKRDREVVMEAVKQDGYALEFASEELKRDREVVMEAVKHGGFLLAHSLLRRS